MPVNDLTFVPALNGSEMVEDLCGLIAEHLRKDCNLREIDGYSGGYKATVKIHLEAFGLDTAVVDVEISTDETGPGQDVDNPVDLTLPDVDLDTELDVPVEADLSLVRERSSQIAPDFEINPAVELTEEGPVGQPQKRKYSRRINMLSESQGTAMPAGSAQGGATGQIEE